MGDQVDGDGARDTIVIQSRNAFNPKGGEVIGKVVGDEAGGDAEKDYIFVTIGAVVVNGIHGDNLARTGGNGGYDTIRVAGQVGLPTNSARVSGDKVKGNGGGDFILVERGGTIYGNVYGDDVDGKGGEDLIWVDGRVTGNVVGDLAKGGNAKDRIAIRQDGSVEKSVIGDGTPNNKNGGFDTLNITGGTVFKDVIGDDVKGKGGNDFIAIRMNGTVLGDMIGDRADKDGGNDTMTVINGIVEGDMIGDAVGGNGGNDKLNVLVAGTVKGDMIGDAVGKNKNGGDDSIFVSGKVNGKVIGDHDTRNAFAGKDTIQASPSSVIGQGIWGDNAEGGWQK